MANIKSAKKRIKQSIKQREANRKRKSSIRTSEKKLRTFVKENKKEEAKKEYQIFSSLLDKSAKTNVIHKNKANRKKSRLAKHLSTITSESA